MQLLKLVHLDDQVDHPSMASSSSFKFSSSNLFQEKPDIKTVLEDKISTTVEKLGPINLDIKQGKRLYEAWDEAF